MATKYAITGGGNWSGATWATASNQAVSDTTKPVAGDTAILDGFSGSVTIDENSDCTVLDCSGYTGTLAFGNFSLSVAGNVTLGGTLTAGTGGLIVTTTSTMTSNGITFPGYLTFSTNSTTKTLVGNWVTTGLVSFTAGTTLNRTTAETFTCNGGLTTSVNIAGTAEFILGGGTWSGTGRLSPNNVTLNGNVTVSGNVNYFGTLTYTAGTITTTGSTLNIKSNSTLNTNGVIWNAITVSGTSTITLTSNLRADGLFTTSSTTTLNKTSAETFTCNGGMTISSSVLGTAKIIWGGGTWTSSNAMLSNLDINCTTGTVSGTAYYSTGTITYVAGTITTTGSTLIFNGVVAGINTAGITWNDILFGAGGTYTLGSKLTCTGTLASNQSVTFAGNFDVECGTLRYYLTSVARTLTIKNGQSLIVNNAMSIMGLDNMALLVTSSTASSKAYLTYKGTAANQKVAFITFTDIDASGSAQGVDNWYGGTLTRTTNITNRTSADIGGGATYNVIGIL